MISVALPAADVEFYGEEFYPRIQTSSTTAQSAAIDDFTFRSTPGGNQSTKDAPLANISGAAGGGTVGPQFQQLGGRPHCFLTSPTGASDGWYHDLWQPSFVAANWPAGSSYDPPSIVGVFDLHVALTAAAFAGAADTHGFMWLPQPNVGIFNRAPQGGLSLGGFGLVINNDGGGLSQWEFIAWGPGAYPGNITLRAPIATAGFIGDVLKWSTFRTVIIAAGPGRTATLSLEVNGAPIAAATAIPFDDVVLFNPATLLATSGTYAVGINLGALVGGFRWQWHCRFGRFTPGGEEIQAAF